MYMDGNYKRRIRIECKPERPNGRGTCIFDVETGEEITNVASVIIYLDAREINMAKCVYCEHDEAGKLIVKDGEPISKVKNLYNPEIDLTAFEVQDEPPH